MKTPRNKLINGDCLLILDSFSNDSVDLIYLDPPFFTQKDHGLTTRDGEKYYNFSDKWQDMQDYTEHIKMRLIKCRKVLKDTGSLFLHCDKSASHYLKIVLDQVFGAENFQSEIIWSYKRWSNSKKGLLNNHQTIFFYSKTKEFKFNQKYDDYSASTNIDQIVQLRERDTRNKAVYKKNDDGTPVLCATKKGVPMGDVWDIPYLNPKAKERVSYPTQKPILLLERIIELVTNEGDLVLDPYCGSGTTLVAAKILKRDYIGIDKNAEAILLAESRIANPIKSESNLLKKGRESYARTDSKIKTAISNIGAILVHRNKGMDGLASVGGQMVPVKVVDNDTQIQDAIELLLKASQKNGYATKAIYCLSDCSTMKKNEIYEAYGVVVFNNQKELNDVLNFEKVSDKSVETKESGRIRRRQQELF